MKKHRIIFRDTGADIVGLGCLVAIYLSSLVACTGDGSKLTRAIITSPVTNTSVAVGEKVPIVGQVTGENIVRVDVVVDATVHASLVTGDKSKGIETFPVQTDWVPAYTGAHFVQFNVYGPQNRPIGKSDAIVFIVKEVLVPSTTMALLVTPVIPKATVATVSPLPPMATSAPATVTVAPPTPIIRPSPTAKASMAEGTSAATVAPLMPTLTITTRIVNVRSGPGIQYDVLGYLQLDTTVPVRGRNADGTWWQIVYVEGVDGVGWVRSDLGQVNDAANVPVVATAALPGGVPTGMPDAIHITPTPTITATPSAGIRAWPSAISDQPTSAWQIVAWCWPPENTATHPKSGHTIHSCHFV
ncbi:MAG: SH3 domain-containing protein [Chloroflexi bacterium]|nr:SH3 domain-containing protein [Chloroflexota bacterium]